MWLLLAFVAVPVIEIGLFIQVGGAIGTWPTLLIVILTAFLGTYLVRSQGRLALRNLQSSFSQLDDPTEPLAHGAMILFAGALLLTPGFFTDFCGFAMLIPQVRTAAFQSIRKRINIQSFSMGGGVHSAGPKRNPQRSSFDPNVIDGEFEEVDVPRKAPPGPSKWTED